MKTIFAAIDLDSNVDNIIEATRDLARQYGAELILATVEPELEDVMRLCLRLEQQLRHQQGPPWEELHGLRR